MSAYRNRGTAPVIKIVLPYLMDTAGALEKLTEIKENVKYEDAFLTIWHAQNALDGMLNGSVFSFYIRSSRY